MKKFLIAVFGLVLCCALAACGGQGIGSDPSQTPAASQPTETPNSIHPQEIPEASASEDVSEPSGQGDGASEGNRVLIAYFTYGENASLADGVDASTSASIQYRGDKLTGNTGLVASLIADATDGELFAILTGEQYPDTYNATLDVGQSEKSAGARPKLSSHIDDLDRYDAIFLGFPNWWGTLPQAVKGFLEEYDFTGKTIVPFCSHEGSGLGRGPQDIAALCPGTELLDGLAVRGSAVSGAQADVQEWLNGLNLEY